MYEAGSSAILVAKANPGWKFDYWNLQGNVLSEKDSLVAVVQTSARVTAMFSSVAANEGPFERLAGLSVYPNPASGYFSIGGVEAEDVLSVSLLDMQGTTPKTWPAGTLSFPLEDLESGMYLVAVRMKDGRVPVLKLLVR